MTLTKEELSRYQRHLILPGFGQDAQEKLKKAAVLVIGAGGLGCPILQYLVAAGVGTIAIVDDDTVSESNLHRQILYTSADVGKSKVEVAVEKLRASNPFITLIPHNERISTLNALALIETYDFVIDGSDNFSTRYLVNDACVIKNKPLISGSIYTFEGQVSVFNHMGGPTYRCLFPDPPTAEEMPNCAEIGVLGVLPGVIGTIMATEAIKLATGIGEVLSGKLLSYNALNMSFYSLDFEGIPENKEIKELGHYDYSCEITEDIGEISAQELKQWQANGEQYQLIDVRETHEFNAFNIGGINIPLSTLDLHIDKLDRTRKIVIHCQKGGRSMKAIQLLKERFGFTNLINLTHGLMEW